MEVTDDVQETKNSLLRIRKISRIIFLVCRFLLITYIVFWVSVFGATLFSIISPESSIVSSVSASELPVFLCTGVFVTVLLKIVSDVFGDAARGQSPFAMVQVKRLRIAACVLMLDAIFGALLSPGFLGALQMGSLDVSYTVSRQTVIPIDLGEILASICLFGFSLIFKYGVLLQEFSDDAI